jgi:hypothetical protein
MRIADKEVVEDDNVYSARTIMAFVFILLNQYEIY